MKNIPSALLFTTIVSIVSCGTDSSPNVDRTGKDQLEALELGHQMNSNEMLYQELIYVPIYSDIYIDPENPQSLLVATLSIRNTSFEDSLFVSTIDYYNTDGELVKSYIENTISLSPMASVNYVIEKDDDTGGHGANFIVGLSARSADVKPVVQAIMIGHYGNIGFSFCTDGYPVRSE